MNAGDPSRVLVAAAPGDKPGGRLRAAREARGMSIHDITASLNLKEAIVAALEADNYERMPSPTYVRGYIRAYARLLHIDPAPLLEAYSLHSHHDYPPLLPIHKPGEQEPPALGSSPILIVSAAVVAGIVLLGVLWWQSQRTRKGEELPVAATPGAAVPTPPPEVGEPPDLRSDMDKYRYGGATPPPPTPPAAAVTVPPSPAPAPSTSPSLPPPLPSGFGAPQTPAPEIGHMLGVPAPTLPAPSFPTGPGDGISIQRPADRASAPSAGERGPRPAQPSSEVPERPTKAERRRAARAKAGRPSGVAPTKAGSAREAVVSTRPARRAPPGKVTPIFEPLPEFPKGDKPRKPSAPAPTPKKPPPPAEEHWPTD